MFSSFEPAWATDQRVKIFSILVSILAGLFKFSESPQGIILLGVNLSGVSYHGESVSPGYHTVGSHSWTWRVNSHVKKLLNMTSMGQCHKKMWIHILLKKAYIQYSIFEQNSRHEVFFYSPGMKPQGFSFLKLKTRITQQNLNRNWKYFNPLVSAPGRFKLWKKIWRSKISLDCPFNVPNIVICNQN